MNAYEIFIKIQLNLQHLQIDVHALTGNFDMFSHFSRHSQNALADFLNAEQTLWHRNLVWKRI